MKHYIVTWSRRSAVGLHQEYKILPEDKVIWDCPDYVSIYRLKSVVPVGKAAKKQLQKKYQ